MKKLSDLEILNLLADYQVLTIHQIAGLLFSSAQMARKRLRRMEKEGLLARSSGVFLGKRGRPESLVCLSPDGKRQIRQANGVSLEASPERMRQVDHQLLINCFRLELQRLDGPALATQFISASSPFAVDAAGKSLLRNVVPAKPGDQLIFIPDGALMITDKAHQRSLLFYLEVDMGTEALVNGKNSDLRQKIVHYRNYLGLKGYRRYESIFNAKFGGFRTLFLTNSVPRKHQLCRLVQEMQPADFVWITDQSSLLQQGLSSPIWSPGGREPLRSILGSLGNSQPKP